MRPVLRDRRRGGKLLRAVAVIAACGIPGAVPANATFTLQYTGRPFVHGQCAGGGGITCLGNTSSVQASLTFAGLIPSGYTGLLLAAPGVSFTSGSASINGYPIQTTTIAFHNGGPQVTAGAITSWSVFFGDFSNFSITNGEIQGSFQSSGGDYVNFVTGGTFYSGAVSLGGSWTVVTPLQVVSAALPAATAGQPYNQTIQVAGGSGAGYTWSLVSGALPPGFTLSPAGVLASTGAPAPAVQSYSFTVQVTDSAAATATQALTLQVQPPLQLTAAAPPPAVSAQAYAYTFGAAGGGGSYTWSVSAGALPAGYTLSAAGLLSSTGAPAAAPASYQFTVMAADTSGNSATQAVALVVYPTLAISTAALPPAVTGQPYTSSLAATGGSGAGYSWTLTSGVLPPGFTLSAGGQISASGNPAANVQTYPVTIQVTDSIGAVAAQAYSFVVQTPVQIAAGPLPDALTGQAYSDTLGATGGNGNTYTWSVSAGALPPGFTLSAAGLLSSSGHPAAASQTYSFTAKAADSLNPTNFGTRALTLYVEGPLKVGTTALNQTAGGQIYSATLSASGGSGQGYTWAVTAGALPTGFALSPAGILTSTGTPAAPASVYSFTVQVTDSANNTATQTLSLVVQPPPPFQIVNAVLPQAVSGQPYSLTFGASGGSGGGYTWSVPSGLLPNGFTLSQGGILSSAANQIGAGQSFTFSIRVTDSANNTATRQYTLVFLPALSIVTASLKDATLGLPYGATLTAAGGSGTGYAWSIQNGYLPAGFNLSASGTINAPASAQPNRGSYAFVIQVTDSLGSTATQTYTLNVLQPLQISAATLPAANSGQPYSFALTALGGTGSTFTWSVASGSLPAGFSLSGGSIGSAGAATPTGVYSFTVKVADGSGASALLPLTLTVLPPLQVTTLNLPVAVSGQPYLAKLTASGGAGYTWSISGGVLPPGFSLAADGTLSSIGTPPATTGTAAQTFNFTVSVTTPAFINAAFKSLNLTVNPASTGQPAIAQGGVVPLYSASPVIQPGSWVSIFGSNLASASAQWSGDFPTSLAGVSVSINNKPAYLWSVGPNQINLQAPDDVASGTVNVQITTPSGTADSTVTLGPYSPSFSMLSAAYPAAIVLTPGKPGNTGHGYDIVGPSGAFVYPSRPVKAGETLVLYGVGFGPTSPDVPSGKPFTGSAPCLNSPRVTIGGVPAKVSYAGIVETGLYQINVVVPAAGTGDKPLQAAIGGMTTPSNVLITLQ